MEQVAWTFRYSLEGFLKRTLFVAQTPREEAALVEAVLASWARPDEVARETLPERVRAALQAKTSAFRQTEEGEWQMRLPSEDDLQLRALRYLQETGTPQKQGDILRHLQAATGRGRGELMSRLDLDSDPRFARLEMGEWVLTEWELPTHMNEVAAATMMNDETEVPNMSELATVDTLKEIAADNAKLPVAKMIEGVLTLVNQMATDLSARNRGLADEVVSLFDSEDLDGIKVLMGERKRLEALSVDLEALVAKWSAQEEQA